MVRYPLMGKALIKLRGTLLLTRPSSDPCPALSPLTSPFVRFVRFVHFVLFVRFVPPLCLVPPLLTHTVLTPSELTATTLMPQVVDVYLDADDPCACHTGDDGGCGRCDQSSGYRAECIAVRIEQQPCRKT